jgi:opacity protein-like surface antigen
VIGNAGKSSVSSVVKKSFAVAAMLPGLAFIVLISALLCVSPTSAQSVRGRVLNAQTGEGIPSVKVTLFQGDGKKVAEVLTNSKGAFAVGALVTGPHRLQTNHIGYTTVTTEVFSINDDEQVVVDLKVSVTAVTVEPLTIVARRRDPRNDATEEGMFARRLTLPPLGLRRVLLPFDPEMKGAIKASDVIFQNFPQTRRRPCTVVYWNGSLVLSNDMAAQWLETSVSELEAVEYYRNMIDAPMAFREIPVQISFDNRECQIVALWPRTGRYLLEDPPIPLPGALYLWRGYLTATAYHVSGKHAPGTGVGLELSTHNQVYRAIGLALHVRMTRHVLPADVTSEMSTNLSEHNYVLPVGDRGMLLYVVAVEPRVTVVESDRLRMLVGTRIQGAGRRFTLVKNDVNRSTQSHVSYGWGVGASLGLEYEMSEKLALNGGVGYDRLSFGTYKFLESTNTKTAATWSAGALHLGVAYFLNR